MLLKHPVRVIALTIIISAVQMATHTEATELPKVFSEDFERGSDRWEILDPKTWKVSSRDNNKTFEITARKSEYTPAVRSPRHVALIKDVAVSDFELTFRVRSTKDTGVHRDCCIFFGWQDKTHFYYAHLGARPDPASGQIMIVNDAPRRPLTKNEKLTPWNDEWHRVKLIRSTKSGIIAVYFDDMEKPHMQVKDRTYGKGRVGIGSFDDMNEFDDMVLRGE
ncbi:MAG: hypothetical protein MK102_15065 [Fuerstiella sp.]|nr:hypothetical protein [Fuerstiella sp.]